MIQLIAKLGLDSSAFLRGLVGAKDGAKKVGDVMGREVGKDFTKSLKRTIGAAAVVGFVFSQFREAQRITDLAKAAGMTAQEFAALEIITKRFGDTSKFSTTQLKEMTAALISVGQVQSEDSFKTMADQANEATSAWNRLQVAISGAYDAFVKTRGQGIRNVASVKEAADARRLAIEDGASPEEADAAAEMAFANAQRRLYLIDRRSAGYNDPLEPFAAQAESDRSGFELNNNMQRLGDEFYEKQDREREQEEKKKEAKANRYKPAFGSVGNVDEFAKIGLGAGRGGFNVQKQLLDETKLQTAILREANKNIRKLA